MAFIGGISRRFIHRGGGISIAASARSLLHLTQFVTQDFTHLFHRFGFYSLKTRLLVPLSVAALMAAAAMVILSFIQGKRWAMEEVRDRFGRIEQTLRESTFPLSRNVLGTLADLTASNMITVGEDSSLLWSTLPLQPHERQVVASLIDARSLAVAQGSEPIEAALPLADRHYFTYLVARKGGRSEGVKPTDAGAEFVGQAGVDGVAWLLVLFDEELVESSGRRAALFPLVTGLSIILSLWTITLYVSSRLVRRLIKLQRGVEQVATGDFDTQVSDHAADEVGRLGNAVDSLGRQLRNLWRELNRQQSERLLHQIAGGIAHQLRNTLTGSRMAMELHRGHANCENSEEVDVAISQLEVAEAQVRRLLLVRAGEQEPSRPAKLLDCWHDIKSVHSAMASHLSVDLRCRCDSAEERWIVEDGSMFTAAVSNLVLNALQVADLVRVEMQVDNSGRCKVLVFDNGPGVSAEVAEEVFEPFVTSKPEGLGLGLPLVKRAAERLGGKVAWRREGAETVFEFSCALIQGDVD